MADETMVIELDVTTEKLNELTWDQWEVIEGGNPSLREARKLIASFVKGMDYDPAYAMLGTLKTSQMNEILNGFAKAVSAMKSVNPPSGGS